MSARGFARDAPGLRRRIDLSGVLDAVDRGVAQAERAAVSQRRMQAAAGRSQAASHLEEIAEVGVGDELGVERCDVSAGVRDGPLVLDLRVDADAPLDLDVTTEVVLQARAVGQDLR